MKLLKIVQHHPSRAEFLPGLVAGLGANTVVAEDPDPDGRPSAWRTYQVALRMGLESSATHVLVIQDDTALQHHFRSRANTAVRENPGSLLALYTAARPDIFGRVMRAAQMARQSTADLRPCPWVHTVALVWPREFIAPFLEWAQDHAGPNQRGDDNVVGDWAKRHDIPRRATVPCLVEHPDVLESLLKRKHGAGANKARVAALL